MTETDLMPLDAFTSRLAKETNLTCPLGESDRYNTVLETVRCVMQQNYDADVFVAISAMEEQDSAKRLCQDIYEDACNVANSAFDAAVANLDEPWCSLIEDNGCIDASEWVDENVHHAVGELDTLDSWRLSMAKVLAQYLYFFEGTVTEALRSLPGELRD